MPIWSKELMIMVLFGLFVDIDHLFNQMVSGNLYNPDKMVKHWTATAEGYTGALYLFHSYEFMAVVLLAGVFRPIFMYAFIGLALHFVCDAIVNLKETHTLEWFEDYSIIYYLYQWSDYHVVKRFWYSAIKLVNPKSFLNLVALYLIYAYTHPHTVMGWIFSKYQPQALIQWMLEKI
tara:strand:+ start:6919 stop:7449 length:531 start_codon:yes stop_codon:yes gene_type:complete